MDLDWGNLGFEYIKTKSRYVATWSDGKWGDGKLVEDENFMIHESACVLQYCQTCFEGLKAYRTKDGHIQTFRPDLNAERMFDTAKGLMMEPFPKDRFIEAVDMMIRDNADFVPPYGTGAVMYVRPFLFGSGPVIGVKPAGEFTFRVFGTPVGPYYKGGMKSIKLMVSQYDRAAPHGTGHIKAGLNYAMSLWPSHISKDAGFADSLFLDSATRTFVEEASGANAIFVKADGTLVVPKSPTILPSITRRSAVAIAPDLGIKVEERPVEYKEIGDFVECALCGTAAVLSSVASITDGDKVITFKNSAETIGPVCGKIREHLVGIQTGDVKGPDGWVHRVM